MNFVRLKPNINERNFVRILLELGVKLSTYIWHMIGIATTRALKRS
jgi:hypothetical protein